MLSSFDLHCTDGNKPRYVCRDMLKPFCWRRFCVPWRLWELFVLFSGKQLQYLAQHSNCTQIHQSLYTSAGEKKNPEYLLLKQWYLSFPDWGDEVSIYEMALNCYNSKNTFSVVNVSTLWSKKIKYIRD